MGRVMVQPLEGLQMGATGLYAIRLSLAGRGSNRTAKHDGAPIRPVYRGASWPCRWACW